MSMSKTVQSGFINSGKVRHIVTGTFNGTMQSARKLKTLCGTKPSRSHSNAATHNSPPSDIRNVDIERITCSKCRAKYEQLLAEDAKRDAQKQALDEIIESSETAVDEEIVKLERGDKVVISDETKAYDGFKGEVIGQALKRDSLLVKVMGVNYEIEESKLERVEVAQDSTAEETVVESKSVDETLAAPAQLRREYSIYKDKLQELHKRIDKINRAAAKLSRPAAIPPVKLEILREYLEEVTIKTHAYDKGIVEVYEKLDVLITGEAYRVSGYELVAIRSSHSEQRRVVTEKQAHYSICKMQVSEAEKDYPEIVVDYVEQNRVTTASEVAAYLDERSSIVTSKYLEDFVVLELGEHDEIISSISANNWLKENTRLVTEEKTIIRNFPAFTDELPAPYRFVTREVCCEHCKTRRRRSDSYVLRSSTGQFIEVGSTCLANFLNVDKVESALSYASYIGSFELLARDASDSYPRAKTAYILDSFLTMTAAAIRAFGFVPRSEEHSRFSTAERVVDAFRALKDGRKIDFPIDEQDKATAAATVAFVTKTLASKEPQSSYELSLITLFSSSYLREKFVGLAASSVSAYLKHLAEQATVEVESEFVGTEGERMSFELLTLVDAYSYEQRFGITTIYSFQDERGNLLKWFTSGSFDGRIGEQFKGKATVEKHQVYKGKKETLIKRAKLEYVGDTPAQERIEMTAKRKNIEASEQDDSAAVEHAIQRIIDENPKETLVDELRDNDKHFNRKRSDYSAMSKRELAELIYIDDRDRRKQRIVEREPDYYLEAQAKHDAMIAATTVKDMSNSGREDESLSESRAALPAPRKRSDDLLKH